MREVRLVILSEAKDLSVRRIRSFAVAQDDIASAQNDIASAQDDIRGLSMLLSNAFSTGYLQYVTLWTTNKVGGSLCYAGAEES